MVWLQKSKAALFLAPMEGVTDSPMRALQSALGGFTHTVTEFLRINQTVPPPRIFVRHMVELKSASHTASGTPVILQLLGGDAGRLAESAALGARLGAAGIDLNFGCPAPTVNRHDGGATLLKYPERILTIVSAVRAAVPKEIPVSVKMRLGWDSHDPIYKNAEMAVLGGASWISVHGRSKTDGYRPPAYWEPIGELVRTLPIPVVANGEIWTLSDFQRCREITGASHYMLGRGALADPFLALKIAKEIGLSNKNEIPQDIDWPSLLSRFVEVAMPLSRNPNYVVKRVKQWLRYAHLRQNFSAFDEVKKVESLEELNEFLAKLRVVPKGHSVVNLF